LEKKLVMAMKRARPDWLLALAIGWLPLASCGRAQAEFALHDGDTVVFLGDSITAARTYGKIVENYTLLRFPDRKVHFINAGWGGDTAAGGLKRLERNVFDRGATVLIVAYGINDIGWGLHADAEHKRIYLDAIRGIVAKCKARGVCVFIGSAAITAEDPERAEQGFLQTMCDEGMAIARELGEHSIDIQRTMRSIQHRVIAANASAGPKDQATLHAADGIHLSDLGQLAMAFAILKGLGAPAEVSSLSIDAAGPRVLSASGCRATNLSGSDSGGRLEFDRLDDGLPVNFGVFGALQFRYVPIPDELDRYMLTVKNLAPGRYEILADGRALGTFTDRQLAGGLNIASATADGWEPGGPWDAEAALLIHLTDARDRVDQADRLLGHYLPRHPERSSLHAQSKDINNRIETLQRTLLKPRPFHFLLRRTETRYHERHQ
jgi:lysophospholipase L1-like esterase